MEQLKEEILEIRSESEIILMMDGNGKVGLLGEKTSRNGKLLENVFEHTGLTLMNKSRKCKGVITRQNRKNTSEKSAIDFVVSSMEAESMIESVTIDEEGLYRFKGKCESDHNTIMTEMNIAKKGERKVKRCDWRLNAPDEKWQQFRNELRTRKETIEKLMKNGMITIDEKYDRWMKEVEKSAMSSIGKTTFKNNESERYSLQVHELRQEKRNIKKKFLQEQQPEMRKVQLEKYKDLQIKIRQQIDKEQKEKVQLKFEKMIESKSSDIFWKERKKMNRDTSMELLVTKNEEGDRLYDPEKNQENIARYYEKLFGKQNKPYHPYHDTTEEGIREMLAERRNENERYNKVPDIATIKKVIMNKKNGKATTDLKNELLKGGGHEMSELIEILIREIWETENVPEKWNMGHITSIWKNKGDREQLKNHRGITVSSGVSMVMEEILNNIIIDNIKFTQSQGGGKKGSMTCDHLFIIYALTALSKHKNKKYILTFYDIQKAYDHADINDMLYILWQSGVKGKSWRLIKKMNENLTAQIKTRYGFTRKIMRETGGKQGGKTSATMFAKMTDMMPEKMLQMPNMGIKIGNAEIPALLWVDDVVTISVGEKQQNETLSFVSDYAEQHKFTWGVDKCSAMELGKHRNVRKEWKLGEETIHHNQNYKYLGDIVTRNGSHTDNIAERLKKVKNSTVNIITCGKQEIMRKIEVHTLLKLHEAVTIPTMLHNAESWTLTKTDMLKYEHIEIWALKRLLNLPEKTLNVAVRYVTGTLLIKIRIDYKQLVYLKKLLGRGDTNWTFQVLSALDNEGIGWARWIREKLNEYNLEENWEIIEEKSANHWRREVKAACEQKNRDLLVQDCTKREGSETSTKTKTIYDQLQIEHYKREPLKGVMELNKLRAKTIIMARYGMLECQNNFKTKYGTNLCRECNVVDNEGHRLNECKIWSHCNNSNSTTDIHFGDVYSSDKNILDRVAIEILKVWNLENGQNAMKD